ncbi:MAG: type III secretion system export apparatus subunit SctR [Pseudomonadota bacterium]
MGSYDPFLVIAGLLGLSLAPFLLMTATSYLKIVIVFSLIRNALGVQQVPPTMLLNGLAIIFTIFIMTDVGMDMQRLAHQQSFSKDMSITEMFTSVEKISPPLKDFLQRNTRPENTEFFYDLSQRLMKEENALHITRDSFYIILPSFAVSELTRAFEIAFLLYLPFIIVDIIVSNILLALGMMMVSPMTISLPFKLLLFVLLNGWTELIEGLIVSYIQ